jgi:hypothetical protein
MVRTVTLGRACWRRAFRCEGWSHNQGQSPEALTGISYKVSKSIVSTLCARVSIDASSECLSVAQCGDNELRNDVADRPLSRKKTYLKTMNKTEHQRFPHRCGPDYAPAWWGEVSIGTRALSIPVKFAGGGITSVWGTLALH